jgi:Uma2 family endonuclease
VTWAEICEDKRFADLPGKVELNGRGQIILSPTKNYHGNHAFRIGTLLEQLMTGGEVVVECAVETIDGVKEADCAWMSQILWNKVKDDYACDPAPEICVEVISPSNTEAEMMYKRGLFIKAGAQEYWLCDADGALRFFDATSELAASRACPKFPKMLPKRH